MRKVAILVNSLEQVIATQNFNLVYAIFPQPFGKINIAS